MSIDPSPDLVRFHQFLSAQLASGTELSPEQALHIWREENPGEEDEDDEIEVLRAAIADLEAGSRGISLEEFDKQLRARHGLSS